VQADRHQHAGGEWPDEGTEPLPRAPDRVGGNELRGAPGDRGHQRDLGRPDRRAGGGRHRGEHEEHDHRHLVVGHRRAGRDDGEARQGGAGGPDQPEHHEDPIAAKPLDQGPGQHADGDRRNHAHGSEQTGGKHAAEVEDEDEQDDGQRAVGGDADHPRDAEPSNPVVGKGLAKGRDGGSEHARNRQRSPPSPVRTVRSLRLGYVARQSAASRPGPMICGPRPGLME
jgi:hypothetical protein